MLFSNTILTVCFLLLHIYQLNALCAYAILPGSSLPEAMDECNNIAFDRRWDLKSMKRQCPSDGGFMYYEIFEQEDCKSIDPYNKHLTSNIPCYIDHSINECDSVSIDNYVMTLHQDGKDWSTARLDIGSPLTWTYRPNWNSSFSDHMDSDDICYFQTETKDQFGHHWIYDECLEDRSLDAIYPYIKGEYDKGGFETNCSYTINYYSDSKCQHKIDSSLYNTDCKENEWGVIYSYDVDCPWRPNTVWTVIFCILGCCICSCCCFINIKKGNCERCVDAVNNCQCKCEYIRNKCCKRGRNERNANNMDLEIESMPHRSKKVKSLNDCSVRIERKNEPPKNYHANIRKEKDNDNDDIDGTIDKQSTMSYSAMNCVICLDVLLVNEASKLVCGHKFHTHCIEEYNETNTECPLCRQKIVFID